MLGGKANPVAKMTKVVGAPMSVLQGPLSQIFINN